MVAKFVEHDFTTGSVKLEHVMLLDSDAANVRCLPFGNGKPRGEI